MASKKRRQEEEDEIMLADPEDAEVDVLMASPVQHSLLGLDGDELLASNAASIVGMDEPMKRPMAPVMPPPPAPADAENAPRRKKDEWMRKAGGDLQLPLMRVKRVVKSDKDIKHINTAAIVVLSKATELFLDTLIVEAYKRTASEKRKTVQYKDIASAVAEIDAMEFLMDSIPLAERRYANAPGAGTPSK